MHLLELCGVLSCVHACCGCVCVHSNNIHALCICVRVCFDMVLVLHMMYVCMCIML